MDLAELGLSLAAGAFITDLGKVDIALTNTAKLAGELAGKIKSATASMGRSLKNMGGGGSGATAAMAGYEQATKRQQAILKQFTSEAIQADRDRSTAAQAVQRQLVSQAAEAEKEQLAVHKARLEQQSAADKAYAAQSAARIQQATRSIVTGGLSGKSAAESASVFTAPGGPAAGPAFTPSGIASVDAMRQKTAELRAEEARLTEGFKAGTITQVEHARGMAGVTNGIKVLEEGSTRARGAFRQMTAAIASATFEITGAVYGIGALALALASPAIFGMKLQSNIEQTKLALAGVLLSMAEFENKPLTMAKAFEVSAAMTDRLVASSVKYGIELKVLQDSVKSVTAAGLTAHLGLEQILRFATVAAVAGKNMEIPANRIAVDLRDILAGSAQVGRTVLGGTFGITSKMIAEWKALGPEQFFAHLTDYFSGFAKTIELHSSTLVGAWEQLKNKLQLALVNPQVFDVFKGKLKEVSEYIGKLDVNDKFVINPQLVSTLDQYWKVLVGVGEALATIGKTLVTVTPLMIEFAKAFVLLKGIELAGTVGTGLLGIGTAAAAANGSILTMLSNLNKTKSLVLRVAVTAIAWEFGQWLGTQLYTAFHDWFDKQLEPINKLIYDWGSKDLGKSLADAVRTAVDNARSLLPSIFQPYLLALEMWLKKVSTPVSLAPKYAHLNATGTGGLIGGLPTPDPFAGVKGNKPDVTKPVVSKADPYESVRDSVGRLFTELTKLQEVQKAVDSGRYVDVAQIEAVQKVSDLLGGLKTKTKELYEARLSKDFAQAFKDAGISSGTLRDRLIELETIEIRRRARTDETIQKMREVANATIHYAENLKKVAGIMDDIAQKTAKAEAQLSGKSSSREEATTQELADLRKKGIEEISKTYGYDPTKIKEEMVAIQALDAALGHLALTQGKLNDFENAKQEFSDVKATIGSGQGIIQSQVNMGLINEVDARQKLRDMYKAQTDTLQALIPVYDEELKRLNASNPANLADITALKAKKAATEEYIQSVKEMISLGKEQTAVEGMLRGLNDYIGTTADKFTNARNVMTKALGGVEDALVTLVTTGKLSFKSMADGIVADIDRMIIKSQVMPAITNMLGLTVNGQPNAQSGILGAIGGIIGGSDSSKPDGSSAFRAIWVTPTGGATGLLGATGATGGTGGLLDSIGSYVSGLFSSAPATASAAVTAAAGGASMGFAMPAFATGINYVPRDMVARIHQGERIVPASQNKPGMGGDSSVTVITNVTVPGNTDTRTANQIGAEVGRRVQTAVRRNT